MWTTPKAFVVRDVQACASTDSLTFTHLHFSRRVYLLSRRSECTSPSSFVCPPHHHHPAPLRHSCPWSPQYDEKRSKSCLNFKLKPQFTWWFPLYIEAPAPPTIPGLLCHCCHERRSHPGRNPWNLFRVTWLSCGAWRGMVIPRSRSPASLIIVNGSPAHV